MQTEPTVFVVDDDAAVLETAGAAPPGDARSIVLEVGEVRVAAADRREGDEAYRLDVDPSEGIRVVGSDAAGVFYGVTRSQPPPAPSPAQNLSTDPGTRRLVAELADLAVLKLGARGSLIAAAGQVVAVEPVAADSDAEYVRTIELDVEGLEPLVSRPGHTEDVIPGTHKPTWADLGACEADPGDPPPPPPETEPTSVSACRFITSSADSRGFVRNWMSWKPGLHARVFHRPAGQRISRDHGRRPSGSDGAQIISMD